MLFFLVGLCVGVPLGGFLFWLGMVTELRKA